MPGVTVFGARDLPALCAHLADAPDGRLAPVAAPSLARLPNRDFTVHLPDLAVPPL